MAEEKEATEVEEVKNIVEIADSGPCRKKVSIEVPEEAIKAELDKQYEELRRDAMVPGFRKGRAPLRLLEKRFGSDISKQVKLKLLSDASESALKDNELDTLGEPDIKHEDIELPESGAMKFEFEVEVRPEFELPKLEGIDVEKPLIEAGDEQIDDDIMAMRKRIGVWTPRQEGQGVENDDQVVVDAILKVEDAEEDEKLDNLELIARGQSFVGPVPVEGLDEVLAGAKAGDVKKVSVDVAKTFFREEYRGKKVDIEMAVKDIKQLVPADVDEAFLGRLGVETADDLREMLSDARKGRAERDAKTSMGEQVYKYLLENTKFDLPADVVAAQSTGILQRRHSNLLMRGLDRQKIDEKMEELRASSETQAQEQLKLFFIMDKIAEKLEIETTEEELNGYIAQAAASRGKRPEKMREELVRDGSLAQFREQIRSQKCIERLLEDANITDAKASKSGEKAVKKKAKKAEAKAAKKEAKKGAKETAPKAKPTAAGKTAKKADKKEK